MVQNNCNELLQSVYDLAPPQSDRANAVKLIYYIEQCFATGNIDAVNKLFAAVDVTKLGLYALVALIRTTVRARSALPLWDSVYDKVYIEIKNKGRDPDRLLIGIVR